MGKVDIEVNDRPLASIVAEVEAPYAAVEGAQIAGEYGGLAASEIGGSVRGHYLGSAQSHLFCGPEDKTVLLSCRGCGLAGCWPLMARIDVEEPTVVWREFEQPHRAGVWDLRSLVLMFDRGQYERALAAIHHS